VTAAENARLEQALKESQSARSTVEQVQGKMIVDVTDQVKALTVSLDEERKARSKLQEKLDHERSERLRKEREQVEKRSNLVRVGITLGLWLLLIDALLIATIYWPWYAEHANRLGIGGCVLIMGAGLTWAYWDRSHLKWSLGSVGLGALWILVQMIG
jgi:hypothetical protein